MMTSRTVGVTSETFTVKVISSPYGVPSSVNSRAVTWARPLALVVVSNFTDWLCPLKRC